MKKTAAVCVNPLDPGEIAEAVRYIVMTSKMAKRMRLNGRKIVKCKYTWDAESKKLLKLYGEH